MDEFIKILTRPEFWGFLTLFMTSVITLVKQFWGKNKAIEQLKNDSTSIKTSIDLRTFERKFLRKFKNENKNFINNLEINDDLKLFCKTGVTQLSTIFKVVLDAQFEITAEEVQDELAEAKVFMSSQFKNKHAEYERFIPTVKAEMMQFLLYLEDVKVLNNGKRMAEFEKLCKKTSIGIISSISK